MKKLRLLKLAFVAFLVTQATVSKAQLINLVEPTFLVNSPAAVAGVKSFTMSHDGDPAGTTNWGRAIDSFWFNIPVALTSDSLAITVPTPGSLSGKFALVSRGTNNFSEKAYNVQQAGALAIVIYNNIAGGAVGMAAGINASLVTIPVIMISQSDGLAMKAQILNGQAVNASLTNWGFGFTHDLGIINNSMALLHNMATPKYELDGDTALAYRSYLGALVANVGAATENNLKLKSTVSFTPTSGSPTTVLLQDSVMVSTFSTIDSVIEMLSPRAQVLPAITQTGRLDVNYQLTAAATDDQNGNNTMTVTHMVTDSIYSKARINSNGEPTVTIGYRFSGQFVNTWGPLFWINNGNHYAVKSQFTVSNGTTGSNLDGSSVTLYVFKWVDANNNKLIDALELDLKGAGVKNFTPSDTNYMVFTADIWSVPSQQPLTLDANSFYWIAAEVTNDLFLGCDGGINYFMRPYTAQKAAPQYKEYWAPQFQGSYNDLAASTGFLTHFPFQGNAATDIDSVSYVGSKGLVPAVTLHTSMNVPNAVSGINNISELKVYPNPSSDVVNVKIKAKTQMDMVQVSVLDAVGKVVYRDAKAINGKAGQFALDVSGYTAGNYFLVIRSGASISSATLSIVK